MTHDWTVCLTVSTVALAGLFWAIRFRYLLPLERLLADERRRSSRLASFVRGLLRESRAPDSPEGLSESFRGELDRFLARFPGMEACVWFRTDPSSWRAEPGGRSPVSDPASLPEGGRELHVRRSEASSRESVALPAELWRSVSRPEGVLFLRGEVPAALGALEEVRGKGSLRLLAWGTPGRVWGLLAAAAEDPDGRVLERHADALGLLAAYFASVSERAAGFWELRGVRERLEGGLDMARRRLDETSVRLVQRTKAMKTLQEVTDTISAHPDQPEVLGAIVSMVAQSLAVDVCVFLLLDEAAGELVTQPGAYGISDDEGSLYRISVANEASTTARVFRSGEPFLTGDALHDPRVDQRYTKLWKCQSLMMVPLRVEGRRIGVLRVGSLKKEHFNEDDLQLLQVIAEEAAVLVESALLTKKLSAMSLEMARLHQLKDDFISTVSHEFKTPLTSLTGFLSVLLDGEVGPINGEQRRFLGIAKSASERLSALVSDMLDISKLEDGLRFESVPVALGEVARLAVEGQEASARERGVRLATDLPPGLPMVRGDAQWLLRVFDNLISNALKFTPEGGGVTVSLEAKGDCLRACVRDTGMGIPKEDLPRVFEKFYRVRSGKAARVPGTGLGLAICKTVVEKHEGMIWVESEQGAGTRFYFSIPASQGTLSTKAVIGRSS